MWPVGCIWAISLLYIVLSQTLWQLMSSTPINVMIKMQSCGYSHHPITAFIMHPHYKFQSATHNIRHLILEPIG